MQNMYSMRSDYVIHLFRDIRYRHRSELPVGILPASRRCLSDISGTLPTDGTEMLCDGEYSVSGSAEQTVHLLEIDTGRFLLFEGTDNELVT